MRPAAPPPGAGAKTRRARGAVMGLAAAIGLAGLAAWLFAGGPSGSGSGALEGDRPLGGVTGCQARPPFTAAMGLGPRAALGTSVEGVKGLAVIDPDKPLDAGGVFQHPSWDDAGYLGPFVYDRDGNVYVAPVPLVSLEENPPAMQNRVYRVDGHSMAMAELVDLPAEQPPSGANPFGVIGLAYDCDTHSLYAASVAGSTASTEAGRIHRIDLTSGAVASHLDGADPFGLAAFNGTHGKRLYYGLARRPDIYSVALDAAGDFVGELRHELSLADLPDGTHDKARRIRIGPGPAPEMTIQTFDFTYSLKVASERRERVFVFAYDPGPDAWSFQSELPAAGGVTGGPGAP